MTKFVPLTTNATDAPVLLIDSNRPYLELQECAEQRLSTARALLWSLSSMVITHADGRDVNHLADAAYLLLEDASDLFQAARQAALREEVKRE
ncbi:hypothetical protein GFM12_06865 [Pseudomonas aeruginosa]|uniref:hypothetical protein n=1 Tax=Pseudomonas aeruginosa TaxID=287 RepID=UPI00190D867B|nr:hypothetical protein [Pseudomonas aeruginosa]MBK3752266.1 hypothetical protein [Pseudomonas aeruginosa]MBK3762504.1 hypothetical protein [Pseudomonas aeruginosa]MBK3769044.1 hypothetical protein [Pseudomonas aeruginosa]MBK3789232.1 hypothetical protein [Pseudomonas aeruginosa]MBK3885278.1 hypothetical protein [Pseudomonas aeruginosa]